MLFRINSNEKLFQEWRNLEQETKTNLLASLVQNDMFMPHDKLNEDFERFHTQFIKLHEKYSQTYLAQIADLRDRTAQYIKDINTTPITEEEFLLFRKYCPHFAGQWESKDDEYQGCEPVLVHCSHVENPLTHEGNCTHNQCPYI